MIAETGRVTGRVRYNQLMIHEGGRISGDVQRITRLNQEGPGAR